MSYQTVGTIFIPSYTRRAQCLVESIAPTRASAVKNNIFSIIVPGPQLIILRYYSSIYYAKN